MSVKTELAELKKAIGKKLKLHPWKEGTITCESCKYYLSCPKKERKQKGK